MSLHPKLTASTLINALFLLARASEYLIFDRRMSGQEAKA